jgi:glycosyltransferase 2 family protein
MTGPDAAAPAAGEGAPSPFPWDRWVRRVIAVTALTMAAYLALAVWSGWGRLSAALASFPPASLAGVVALVLAGWGVRAARWHLFALRLGFPLPLGASLLAFFASFALTATPGKAGEVAKAGLLRARFGVPMADTAGVLLAERVGDLVAVLLLAAGGLSLAGEAWVSFLACGAVVAGVFLFTAVRPLHDGLLDRLSRFGPLRPLCGRLRALFGASRSLMAPAPLAAGLALAALAWACEAGAFALVLAGFGHPLPLLTASSIYGLATLIGALSFLPGGVGGVEGGMFLLLAAAGVPPAAAVPPVLLIRFSTLWLVSLLGALAMAAWWGAYGRAPAGEGVRP